MEYGEITVLGSKLPNENSGIYRDLPGLSGMAHEHVVCALVNKYREIAGKLQECDGQAERLRADLSHLDATIRLFNADFDTKTLKPLRPYRRNPVFRKGELLIAAIDTLRTANEPLTAFDLARVALSRKGISSPDDRAVEQVGRVLRICLVRYRKASVAVHRDTSPWRFSIAR